MFSRVKSFIDRNPVTPSLFFIMLVILIAQLYIATYSTALFEFMFVGQNEISPGLLLAPLSHGAIWAHFVPNMILLFALGWSLESYLGPQNFLTFTAATAYIPTFFQIVYSAIMTGSAGTLGFSGAVYAYPPVVLCLCYRNFGGKNLGTAGYFALGVTIAIPLQIVGLLGMVFPSPLPAADITHTTGYLLGGGYGLILLLKSQE